MAVIDQPARSPFAAREERARRAEVVAEYYRRVSACESVRCFDFWFFYRGEKGGGRMGSLLLHFSAYPNSQKSVLTLTHKNKSFVVGDTGTRVFFSFLPAT